DKLKKELEQKAKKEAEDKLKTYSASPKSLEAIYLLHISFTRLVHERIGTEYACMCPSGF
ncbi:MAG: hypothetical protein ACKPAD_01410, partial [Bacteroidota bacterium]